MSRLDAGSVVVAEENGVLTIAFADSADSPVRWLVLQRTLKPTSQDGQLGHDQVHVSTDVNSAGMYGGITKASVSRQEIRLTLAGEARMRFAGEEELVVRLGSATVDYVRVVEALTSALQPVALSNG